MRKQNNVSSDVFELYYSENRKMNLIVPIDMNNKKTTNVEVGDDDGDLVNFIQLNSYVNAAKILLNNKITELTTKLTNLIDSSKSYYDKLFEHYFDLLDPN